MSDEESPVEYLLSAYIRATDSRDPSTQNGAVLIRTVGGGWFDITSACNNPPNGLNVTQAQLEDRESKLNVCEHAERAVIFSCLKSQFRPMNSTMYCPFVACPDCARAIIAAGISKVVCHTELMMLTPERWQESVKHGLSMLKNAGVIIEYFTGPIPGAPVIRFDGRLFDPTIPGFVKESEMALSSIEEDKEIKRELERYTPAFEGPIVGLNRSVLQDALEIAGADRSRDYGHPLPNHERIANFWNTYIKNRDTPTAPLEAVDVAYMMMLMKLARLQHTFKRDSLVDIAGYVRCAEMIIQETDKEILAVTGS